MNFFTFFRFFSLPAAGCRSCCVSTAVTGINRNGTKIIRRMNTIADEMKYTQEEIRAMMNEELRRVKKNAGKELKPDEMEQVSGGAGMSIMIEGEEFSQEAFDKMIMNSIAAYGMGTAICFFKNMTGTKSHFYEPDNAACRRSYTDEEYMRMELKRYWINRQQGII